MPRSSVVQYLPLIAAAMILAGAESARAGLEPQFRAPTDGAAPTTPSADGRYDNDDGAYDAFGGQRGLSDWTAKPAEPITTETGKLTCICARPSRR